MRKAVKKIVGVGLLLLCSAASQAATVIFDPGTTNATAINGLDTNGDTVADFDLTFWNLSDADPDLTELTSPTPCGGGANEPPCGIFEFVNLGNPGQVGDVDGAQAAANAIRDALQSAGATSAGTSVSPLNLSVAVLYQMNVNPCGDQGRGNCGWRVFNSGTWGVLPAELSLSAGFEYAVFAPPVAPVPLPPAIWLFGSGLAALGCLRRRRTSAGTNAAGTNA